MKNQYAIRSSLLPLSLILLGLAVHWPSLTLGFLSDDYVLLEAVRQGKWHWLSPFPAGSPGYFRPLVLGSLKVVPSNLAAVHHLLNLVIHLGCTMLVYACARSLQVSKGLALVAGAWFCLHLANLTDVYWISGRTDSLCSLFFLLGFWAFLRLWESRAQVWVAFTWLCVLAALLCKEQAIVFVPVYATWSWYRIRFHRATPSMAIKVCFAGILVLSSAYLSFIGRFASRMGQGIGMASPVQMLSNMTKNWIFLAAPFSSAWMAEHRIPLLMAGLLVSLTLALSVWRYWRKGKESLDCRTLAVFVAVISLTMLPTAVFLQSTSPRLLYLPAALMAILTARWLMGRPVFFHVLFVLSLLAMTLASIREAGHWRRNDALAKRCAADFARVMKSMSPDKPFVVLGAPATRHGRLVFGNDMNHAFYHATYKRFGHFGNGSVVGQIEWRGGEPQIRAQKTGPGTYECEIAAPSAFIYDPLAAVGSEFEYGAGKTTILAMPGRGRVSAFRFTFRSKLLKEKPLVFDFNGETTFLLE